MCELCPILYQEFKTIDSRLTALELACVSHASTGDAHTHTHDTYLDATTIADRIDEHIQRAAEEAEKAAEVAEESAPSEAPTESPSEPRAEPTVTESGPPKEVIEPPTEVAPNREFILHRNVIG